jgi:uncharacterized protein (DUF433 family)
MPKAPARSQVDDLRRRRNDTKVGTLRKTYDPDFAEGFSANVTLGTLLKRTGVRSLEEYLAREAAAVPAKTRRREADLTKRVTFDPAVCNGKPTLRGKRITVQTVLEFLSAGESRREILRQYPSLVSEDIDACLAFAASLMGSGFVVKKLA